MTAITLLSPEVDATEKTMARWSADLVALLAGDRRYIVTRDARGAGVSQLTLAADVLGADHVLYFGHGKPDRLGSPSLIADISDGPALRSKRMAAVACHAGSGLGPDLVSVHSVDGFLGFDDQFVVYLGNPAVFGAVIIDALRELIDPNSSGAAALKSLRDGFKQLRTDNQKIEKDPLATKRQRYAASIIWMAAFPNEKTAVWIPPSGGGGMVATV